MFLHWNADAARKNVKRHEMKIDRLEFLDIIRSIDVVSRQGYNRLEWHQDISKRNIRRLRELGYGVNEELYYNEIFW